ncbi:MAG: hypothetical protein ACFNUP_05780 [Leptotrichia hofstadii]|jgi:hypothetical protein
MKNIFFILTVILWTVDLHAQSLKSKRHIETLNKNSLVETAKNVVEVYGPAYIPFIKDTEISKEQTFKKEDYGDSSPEIKKQIGRKYYTVTFTYDSTSVKFSFDYAAKVRIWKDTGEPMDIIFGNGMGRNFFFQNFKKQTNYSAKKKIKKNINLTEQVPLQTRKVTKSIWK